MDVPTVQIDLRNGEQFSSRFRKINAECTVPVLELYPGFHIIDTVGICRYLEETFPDPPLFGRTALEKALVDAWLRWSDREGIYAVMDAFRNTTPGFRGRALPGPDDYPQLPELAARSRLRIASFFRRLDRQLEIDQFLAGDEFSIADITALVAIDFASWMKIFPPPELEHLGAWLAAVRSRPSIALESQGRPKELQA